jgi:5-methylcytosine-specific restriction endonuclease McrA
VSTASPYAKAEYQRNRKLLLADHPPCAIAGPNCSGRATTADHIVAIAAGGDNSLTNLRPSCAPCNGHLGGKLGRARQLAVLPSYRSSENVSETRSLDRRVQQHPPIRREISGRANGHGQRSPAMVEDVPTSGRIEPRLRIASAGDGSFGPQVTAWAALNMPYELMAWNCNVVDDLLTTDHGRLVHRRGLVSVARQNSKTTLAIALAGWWLTEYADRVGPQTVVWMAHDLKLSEIAFFQLGQMIDHRIVARSSSYGRQRLRLDNGSHFHVTAATIGAGHGLSIDLAMCDEVWRISSEAFDHGIVPAQRARPQPLALMLSTAGDEQSVLLREWRERGMAMCEANDPGSLFFAEWSPPPAVDYSDPRWWAWANPALGHTIDAETLLDEWRSPNRPAFMRASLNLWIQSEASWLEPGVWNRAHLRKPPEPSGGVVACEISQGGDRFYATRAWMLNGITHVAPLVVTEHEEKLWAAIDAVYGDLDQLLVTPPLQARVPPAWRKVTVVGIRELARSVPILRSMLAAGNVAHDGSALMAEHVGRAIATRSAGLSTAASGPIELARCMVWSVALASRPQSARKPALGVARS